MTRSREPCSSLVFFSRTRISSCNGSGRHGEGQHGDVVLLAEGLGSQRDILRSVDGELTLALEPKQLAAWATSLHHAIGEQGELDLGVQPAQIMTAPPGMLS